MQNEDSGIWTGAFAFFAAVLVCSLIYLIALSTLFGHKQIAFIICGISALLCILIGFGLRSKDRVDAADDGLALGAIHAVDDGLD